MKHREAEKVHNEVLAQYEKMRADALGAGALPSARRAEGAALLIRRGMAAWMASGEDVALRTRPTAQRSEPSPPAARASSELISILSAIILKNCTEKCHA